MLAAAVASSMPGPRLNDTDEVQCALAVAAARWEHGDCADSLRWVRRAARSAADNEHLDRALELSKAASKMARFLAQRTSPATPTETRAPRGPVAVPDPSPSQSETRRIRPRAPEVLPSIFDGEEDEPTAVRSLRGRLAPRDHDLPPPTQAIPATAALTATRVAVVRQPSTGRPELLVLAPGARPPAGAACALLVACSAADLDQLAALLANSVVS
jgi:hypothetical protein